MSVYRTQQQNSLLSQQWALNMKPVFVRIAPRIPGPSLTPRHPHLSSFFPLTETDVSKILFSIKAYSLDPVPSHLLQTASLSLLNLPNLIGSCGLMVRELDS